MIFKLKPKTDGGAWDRVARVLEGTSDPGEAPADPSEPAEGAKPKKPSPKQLRKYEDAKNAWQAQYNASRDLPPDPSDRFVAGFVDDDGYLVPVHGGSNPWLDSALRRDPDAYKLGLGETYQACLLRHPDPALARAVARHLNGEASAADAKYGIGGWGTLLRDVKVESKTTESGEQYVMVLSEDPSHFLPAGPARFGGWALYLDMPHAMCANVPDQIEKLHEDLARLRYPTGEEYPFKFRGKEGEKLIKGFLVSRSLAARVRYAKAKAKDPKLKVGKAGYMQEHVFRIQSQLVSAIGGFQEDLLARRAFLLLDKAAAFEKGRSWAYVLGADFTFAEGSTEPGAWQLPAYLYLGVADTFTASMIEHWEAHGLRKPGSVMVETQHTGYGLWMQERAAVAVDAWALLLRAFGVDYTKSALHGGSSFRRLVDDPWPGSIKASLHNSGFAIDLTGGGRRHSIPLWPIRFEADWVRKSERERAKLASADPSVVDRGNLEHILMFKLYAHSSLDVFGGLAAALATLRANLEALAREDGAGALRDAFLKLFKGLDAAASEAYVAAALQPAVTWARALRAKSDDDLVQSFFRRDVHQFLVNAYEADAGTSMPA
ncbi:MAG: hypothetical protein K8H88_33110, partial [Sandaracinaceae bacterium]|nr:hypothetical protein [Sandaracinaceae bacterium]